MEESRWWSAGCDGGKEVAEGWQWRVSKVVGGDRGRDGVENSSKKKNTDLGERGDRMGGCKWRRDSEHKIMWVKGSERVLEEVGVKIPVLKRIIISLYITGKYGAKFSTGV